MTTGHVPRTGDDLACVGRTLLSVAFDLFRETAAGGCPRSRAFETWALMPLEEATNEPRETLNKVSPFHRNIE